MSQPKFKVSEFEPLDVEGGYLIDGFPSAGLASAIATESLIHTTKFELGGTIDSDLFPAVSIVKNGTPNYPTRIFVQRELKIVVFSSFLTLHDSLHKSMARFMLSWAKRHKIGKIITSIAVRMPEEYDEIIAAASTDSARGILRDSGIKMLQNGTIPGLSGALLNQGATENRDVIAVLYNSTKSGPDFRASAKLCMAMSKLVPGAACNIETLNSEAQKAEKEIMETDQRARNLKDGIYG